MCCFTRGKLGQSAQQLLRSIRGQATVEAALLLPLTMLLILVLCQPAILLYNRVVMENAAAEGCRILSGDSGNLNHIGEKNEGFVIRRLSAIPAVDIFHVGTSAQDWDVSLDGGGFGDLVSVRIVNRVRPLPLLGWGAQLLGQTDADGYLAQTVEVWLPSQPNWVFYPPEELAMLWD
jgi:hypothetical protein